MGRRTIQCLLVCLAFAAAILVPLRVQAAILPACENRELATMVSPPEPSVRYDSDELSRALSCSTEQEATGEIKVAAMCDARGASAIAPPRILGVSDARIETVPSCTLQGSAPMIGPGPKDPPSIGMPLAFYDQAAVVINALVYPALSELLPPYALSEGSARQGIEHGIFRPPR